MPAKATFLPAADAAKALGVRLPTLYSYVSRGLIRTRPHPADPRARLYAVTDVGALIARRDRARRPAAAVASALDWGLPVLETSLSSIERGRLHFRGVDAVALAETDGIEETAAHLWAMRVGDFGPVPVLPIASARSATDRAIARLAVLLPDDPPGATGEAAMARAKALVRHVAEAASDARLSSGPLHAALAEAWGRPVAADVIRRALVLSADHELNASSFAVRVAASTGASLTNCLVAGLATLSGPTHGASTERVAAFLDEVARASSPGDAVAARLGRGESVPGFGHPLYPDGDPRAAALLSRLGRKAGMQRLVAAVEGAIGRKPNIDFALVSAERAHRLPAGAALALFAIGRTVGWIAHALEQRANGQLIRPRARYVGSTPVSATPAGTHGAI